MNNIITFQEQNCKINRTLHMSKDNLPKDCFDNIFKFCIRSKIYEDLIQEMKDRLKYQSCEVKLPNIQALLNITNTNSRYQENIATLRKLGVMLIHNGALYLNPLVATRTTSKTYEKVIEYYSLLLEPKALEQVNITYKNNIFTIKPIEDLKKEILEIELSYQNHSPEINKCLVEELYPLTCKTTKGLYLHGLENNLDLELINNIKRLKAKLQREYTNIGHLFMKELAAHHFEILKEQLPIVQHDKTLISYGKPPKGWKCIRFQDTKHYKKLLTPKELEVHKLFEGKLLTPIEQWNLAYSKDECPLPF